MNEISQAKAERKEDQEQDEEGMAGGDGEKKDKDTTRKMFQGGVPIKGRPW